MIKKNLNYLLIIALLFIFSPTFCLGQVSSAADFVNISINPANPSPNQQVQLSVKSLSLDLDRAKITWYINGVEKKTEIGSKDYFLQAGVAGKTITVGVLIQATDGTVVKKESFFVPAGIDLLFEAISYTPPFYKGKTLNPKQGTVVVVAFPEVFDSTGKKFATNELIYNWRKDGLVQADASGLGKNYFVFSGTIPARDAEISVTASSLDKKMTAENTIVITNVTPHIAFYEDNPVYGIMFNRAIKNSVKMISDEFKVKAFPYFMSVSYSQSPDLNYNWTINGRTSPNLDTDKSAMLFRQESAGAGTANIDLKIENVSRIFQFMNNSFTINFEKQ
jgi:hypothetical protein